MRARVTALVLLAACAGPRPAAPPPPSRRAIVERHVTRNDGAACAQAAGVRARLPALAAAGKLDRLLRVAALARSLCPREGAATWDVELPALTEVGRDDEARALATRMLTTAGADAARAVQARPATPLSPDDAESAADALLAAAETARQGGDLPGAQRLVDRALVAYERAGMAVTLERHLPLRGDLGTWSPDGKRLAVADDNEVSIVDPIARREVLRLRGHTAWISGLAYSPGGELLASSSADGTLRLWRMRDGVETRRFESRARLSAAQFSADGTQVSADTGERRLSWPSGLAAHLVAPAPAAARTGVLDMLLPRGVVEVHALTGKRVVRFENTGCRASSPDGRVTVVGLGDGSLVMVNARTMVTTPLERPGQHGCLAAVFSPDGRRFATDLSWDGKGTVTVRDSQRGKLLFSQPVGDLRDLRMPGDGHLLVAGGFDAFQVWGVPGGQVVVPLTPGRFAELSPDGRWLRSTTWDGSSLLDLTSGERWPPRPLRLRSLVASPAGDDALALESDGTVYQQRWAGGRVGFTRLPALGPVEALARSSSGGRLATLGMDGALRVWDASGAPVPSQLPALGPAGGNPWFHRQIALTPAGDRLLVIDELRARSLDVATGAELAQIAPKVEPGDRAGLEVSPDAALVWRYPDATPGSLTLYDPALGKQLGELPMHDALASVVRLAGGDLLLGDAIPGGGSGASPIRVVAAITASAPATHRRDCLTRRWRLTPPVDVRSFPGCGPLSVAADRLVVAGTTAIDVWELASGLDAGRLPVSQGIRELALAADARRLVGLSAEAVHEWSLADARELWAWYPGPLGGVVLDGDGHVDILGDSSDALVCRAGARSLPLWACLERHQEPELASRRLAGESIDPLLPAQPARREVMVTKDASEIDELR